MKSDNPPLRSLATSEDWWLVRMPDQCYPGYFVSVSIVSPQVTSVSTQQRAFALNVSQDRVSKLGITFL